MTLASKLEEAARRLRPIVGKHGNVVFNSLSFEESQAVADLIDQARARLAEMEKQRDGWVLIPKAATPHILGAANITKKQYEWLLAAAADLIAAQQEQENQPKIAQTIVARDVPE